MSVPSNIIWKAQAGDYNAGQVTFTPIPTIGATNVQSAIVQTQQKQLASESIELTTTGAILSIPSGAWTTVSTGAVQVYNDGTFHTFNSPGFSITTNTGLGAHLELVSYDLEFASNNTGLRGARFLVSGGISIAAATLMNADPTGPTYIGSSTIEPAIDGTTFQLQVFQNSGVSLNLIPVNVNAVFLGAI